MKRKVRREMREWELECVWETLMRDESGAMIGKEMVIF